MNHKSVFKLLSGIFWVVTTFFFGSLIVLAFFNHACADDYFALINEQHYGIGGFQQFVYMHWGGRYTSNLIAAMFSANGFFLNHYYLHSIILILLTLASVYILITSISNHIINQSIKCRDRIVITFLMTINLFVVYPELSSALYWFSSAVTYQVSVIVLMMIVAIAITLLQTSNKKIVSGSFIALLILIAACNGSSEVSAIFSGLLMLIVLILNKKRFNVHRGKIVILALFYVISIIILIAAPGNRERMNILQGKDVNIVLSVVSAFYRVFVVYWNIFQSPLFWATMVSIFLYAIHIRERIFVLRHHKTNLRTILLFITVWSIVLLMVLIPILMLSNGSIPDRALNVLSAASFIVFVILSFYMGICIMDKNIKQLLAHNQFRFTVATVLIICIIANNTTKEIVGSLISAKTYHYAMRNRENMLYNASTFKVDTISVPIIETSMEMQVNAIGANQKAMMKEWMKKKPTLLFISDDIATPASRKVLQDYYKVKCINAK